MIGKSVGIASATYSSNPTFSVHFSSDLSSAQLYPVFCAQVDVGEKFFEFLQHQQRVAIDVMTDRYESYVSVVNAHNFYVLSRDRNALVALGVVDPAEGEVGCDLLGPWWKKVVEQDDFGFSER